MPPPDFGALPPKFQQLLRLAKEKHHLDVIPLAALTGGQTGAFLYLASVSGGAPHAVQHFVIKFDQVNPKAKPSEIERHRLALAQASADFASQNMPQLAYEVEHEGAAALFYTLAGQSLQRFRTLASEERQSRLEALFDATNDYLLRMWNAEAAVEQALHPQALLARWLGYRLKPDGQIASFLQDIFSIDSDTEGFLIQGQIFPNPLSYGLNTARWQETRAIDVLTGLQHGDLNTGNVLARFEEDSDEIKGYFLIDFALYKAQMPLLYDQAYLEMSYLVRELDRAAFGKWVTLVSHFSSQDMPNPKAVPVELAGACAVINAGRRSFERWVHETHPSLSDDLWGQRWLAAVAAGLNYCNKTALPTEARLAGLIYSAVHLKRYCGQFGVPHPVEVRLLYDASKGSPTTASGKAVAAPAPQQSSLAVPPGPAANRQTVALPNIPSGTVTFLFTDIEGSTKLWEQHPQAMQAALARHDAILHRAVEDHHGRLVKSTGDGIHAAFDTAANALAAAVAAQQALFAEQWIEIQPQVVRVRMGLHTGEGEARAGDYFGPALNRAARLMSIGCGGQVLLSSTTVDLVRDQLPAGVSLRDLGEHRLKDLVRAERVYQLVHPDLPADFPPLKSLNAIPNNLPTQLSTFIGRQAQVKAVKDLLIQDPPGVRLLTLTGPGGTGKTRLALQAAADLSERFDGGEFFVDLAPIREPEPVLAAIAQAIGLRQASDRPLLDDLKAQLRVQRMLLLLDNFEQVTAAAPKVVDLLRDCPKLKMLVTSREALHVSGEHVFPIPPLALPAADLKPMSVDQLIQIEAIRLFCERAQAVKPDFALTDVNAAAVAEICLRLDGLPLAIELASARIRLFTPQALLERVGSRLKLLRGGARDQALRQQTLRAAIDWSYELLTGPEQRLFSLLSVFPSCTYDAVEAVVNEAQQLDEMGADVLEALASLVDKSLIRRVDRDNGESRLLMLETIREYAAERLNEEPEFSAAAHWAHATYFANFAQRQGERMAGEAREAALAELEADIENVRTAWSYWVARADLEQLGKFTDSLWSINDARGWYHATVDLTADLLRVLESTPPTPEHARQEIVLRTSLARALLAVKGYTPEVEVAYNRALELSETAGETAELFPVLRGLYSFYCFRAQFDKVLLVGTKIMNLAERYDDAYMRVEAHLALGTAHAFSGDIQLGLEHLDKGISYVDPDQKRSSRFRLGNYPGVVCYAMSALVLWGLGYPDRALERALIAVDLARKTNHPYSMAFALFHAGLLQFWCREMEESLACARALLEVADKHGFQIWIAVGICLQGAGLASLGQPEEGLALIQRGMDMYQGLKSPPIFWGLLRGLQAGVCGQAGRPEEGLALLEEVAEFPNSGYGGVLLGAHYHLKGGLLLARSPDQPLEAESMFRLALETARGKRAHTVELRAAISLARLWSNTDKAQQGRQLLSDTYAKFTEGFTTPDLKEAKALLEGLQT